MLVFALSFCCGCIEESAENSGGALAGPVWVLETYMGVDGIMTATLGASPVTAEFTEGSVLGDSGCNQYNAAYITDGASLTFDTPVVTLIYCEEPGVMAQESRYLFLMGTVAGYTVSDDRLTLKNSSKEVILTFRKVDQNLTETQWTLSGYRDGTVGFVSVLAGSSVTATFDKDGHMSGNTGCNSYSGPYLVAGKSIFIGPLAITEMYCMDPDGVMSQESGYMSALRDVVSYHIGGKDLTLYDKYGNPCARFMPAP